MAAWNAGLNCQVGSQNSIVFFFTVNFELKRSQILNDTICQWKNLKVIYQQCLITLPDKRLKFIDHVTRFFLFSTDTHAFLKKSEFKVTVFLALSFGKDMQNSEDSFRFIYCHLKRPKALH